MKRDFNDDDSIDGGPSGGMLAAGGSSEMVTGALAPANKSIVK